MILLDHLIQSVHAAAGLNSNVQAAPACILWPDKERQWIDAVTTLQAQMPELLVLGSYAGDKRTEEWPGLSEQLSPIVK